MNQMRKSHSWRKKKWIKWENHIHEERRNESNEKITFMKKEMNQMRKSHSWRKKEITWENHIHEERKKWIKWENHIHEERKKWIKWENHIHEERRNESNEKITFMKKEEINQIRKSHSWRKK